MFESISWLQLLGYGGSLLIAISMMMNSIAKLRTINLIGASTFALYGYLFQAYPVFILNSFITIADIYYLVQISRKKDYFELFEIYSITNPFFKRFLDFNKNDLNKYFPDFKQSKNEECTIVFILRNLLPVGLFICKPFSSNMLEIELDYVIPDYRDFKTAHFLYQNYHQKITDPEIKYFMTKTKIPKHISYLKKIGFKRDFSYGEYGYIKNI